jgi:protein TonB
MEKNKKKTLFLKNPEYPGGPKELTKFIYANLKYPEAALKAGVEGTVLVEYDIDFQGKVTDTRVLQSLGQGCDEEACRVVRMLKFGVGKNRGLKVLFHQKAVIEFRKPAQQMVVNNTMEVQLNYTMTVSAPAVVAEEVKPAQTVYSYTVQI